MKLESELLELVKDGSYTIGDVISNLKEKHSEEEIMAVVNSLNKERKIELRESLPASYSLLNYILNPDRSLWFQLLAFITIAVNAIIYFPYDLLALPRIILGFVFVLYIPGLAFVETLFPKKSDLESYERIALSLGLSIVVTILTGVMLNFTSFGIRLVPIATTLSLFSIIVGFVALIRKFKAAVHIRQEK